MKSEAVLINDDETEFIDLQGVLPRLRGYQRAGLSICLVGEPGIGKTTAVHALAGGAGNVRTAIGSKMQLSDLLGRMTLHADSTVWQEGLLVEAFRKGLTFYADELLGFSDDCLRVLHTAIDFRRELVIPGNSQIVKAHPDFRFVASCNHSPNGIDPLTREFRDRLVYVHLVRLDPEAEAKLLVDRHGISLADAEWLMLFAAVTRKLAHTTGGTTRQLEAAAMAIRAGVPRQHAAHDCILAPIAGSSKPQRDSMLHAIRAEGLEIDDAWGALGSDDHADSLAFSNDNDWS